ncbi:hypothetical protein A4X03_0g3320 [Tilletia caries]|uniref:F-box protein Hrt3/FBXO9 C-terminal domain-containing protein n=1 Tax=Tilletia caries TaxID=13290 RepID=A0A8T8TKM1_9BASI|nr:hypothetical protein A4X03_0g3320 [Tilletia caries]
MNSPGDGSGGGEDELQRFREQWKQELQGSTSSTNKNAYSALHAYTTAVLAERKHDLNTALESYRRAFKSHDRPDALYHRACAALLITDSPSAQKGKAKHADSIDVRALLDQPLLALLRTSLEPDTDGNAESASIVKSELSTPHTSPVAPIQPLPEVNHQVSPTITRNEPLPRAPLIPASTSSSPTHNRYTAPTTSGRQGQQQLIFNLPAVKGSTNTLLPILERLIRDPRPERAQTISNSTEPRGSSSTANALVFQPLDESKPCPLARLPDELLLAIAMEVVRPRGRRGEKLPLPIGLHSVPGAPTLGGGVNVAGKQHEHGHNHQQGQGQAAPTSSTISHAHPLGLAMNLALPDIPSLETLGRTCAKWRILTADRSLWRLCTTTTLLPPLIPPRLTELQKTQLWNTLYRLHSNDWRTLWIEHPRLRMNGCYISPCRYTRPGQSTENVWISVVHVVEFYRSIRLLPDGTALSLLTTDGPAETVRRMEGGWKRKGLCVGRWRFFPWGLPEQEGAGRRRRRRRGRRIDQGPVEGGAAEDGLAQGMDNLLLEDAYLDGAEEDGDDDDDDDEEEEETFHEYSTDDEHLPLTHPPSSSSPPAGPSVVNQNCS